MTDEAKLLAYLKRVTADLAEAREELAKREQDPAGHDADDPLVIVSAACRFAGGIRTPEDLWSVLAEERHVVGDFPRDRGWDHRALGSGAEADGSFTDRGAFIHDAGDFDPMVFGMSPREALATDPQQRLVLEVAWEALERAGIPPTSLRGSRTGVFVGATSFNYGGDPLDAPDEIAGSLVTGTVTSVLSGRVSYALGLEGPAITLDTACSSALVALHLATRSIRAGECEAALVGGACIMSTPGVFVEFGRQRGLAPDGLCKSFSDDADGTGWGEGVGLLFVEAASRARRLGHRPLAVVRGSAINCDGASNGLTAPNGAAQERVITAALADAGLAPGDVDVVEAHGTGTRLDDPIEARALLATYGSGRDPERPLRLGSAKSNIGHTQAAAGAGSLIKMILALEHDTMPRTLHVSAPTSEVRWEGGGVELLTQALRWGADPERPRRAAVSGFGVSGTNAHVILEEVPPGLMDAPSAPSGEDDALTGETSEAAQQTGRHPLILPVSAASGAALAAQADATARTLDDGAKRLEDVAATLIRGRSHLRERAAVVASTADEAVRRLQDVARGVTSDDVVIGTAAPNPRPVFVFPGQGSQWVGMASTLLDRPTAFARRIAECDEALAGHIDASVVDLLRRRDADAFGRVDLVQPLLWAVMVSLVEEWAAHGVRPSAVIGHSQGEIAAAAVSGALSLEEAARVCAARARAIVPLTGHGGMLSVVASADTVIEVVARTGVDVALAARNGPEAVVLSGALDDLRAVLERAESEGLRARLVDVDYASHSAQIDRILPDVLDRIGTLHPRKSEIPFYSSVEGHTAERGLDTTTLDAGYWADNLRRTVCFEDAVRTAVGRGHRLFVEASPHPVLAMGITSTLRGTADDAVVTGTLRRDEDDTRSFARSLAAAHVAGASTDLAADLPADATIIDLPTYRFDRRRYWHVPTRAAAVTDEALHEVTWTAREAAPASSAPDSLVLVAPEDAPAARRITTALRERVGDLRVVEGPWENVAAELTGVDEKTDIVLVCPDAAPTELAVPTVEILTACAQAPVRLVTCGAEDLGGAPAAGPAVVRALVATHGAEVVGGHAATVDLPAEPDERTVGLALDALLSETSGARLAVRDGSVRQARLVQASPKTEDDAWTLRDTVLVTGGLGGVGLDVVAWAAARGAGHVVVVSRDGGSADRVQELTERVEATGARLTVITGDVTDPGLVPRLVADLDAPLRAVFHLAGVVSQAFLSDLDPGETAHVLAAKAEGARILHEVTSGEELDAFVVFSAAAGTLNPRGQGHYAAANAYVDALIAQRRAQGLPGTSVAWTAWAPPGMVDETAAKALTTSGVRPLSRDRGLDLLESVLRRGDGHVVVGDIDWGDFLASGSVRADDPLFSSLAVASTADTAAGDDLHRALKAPGADPTSILRDLVRTVTSEILGFSEASEVPSGRSFKDLGIDSLTAVRLRNRLGSATGLDLPVSLAFDHPDADALAAELVSRLVPDPGAEVEALLDEIERALRKADLEPTARRGVVDRLRALGRGLEIETAAPRSTTTDDPLAVSTDEEMFALLDGELDSPPDAPRPQGAP